MDLFYLTLELYSTHRGPLFFKSVVSKNSIALLTIYVAYIIFFKSSQALKRLGQTDRDSLFWFLDCLAANSVSFYVRHVTYALHRRASH